MKKRFYVGIDDTDIPGAARGTGKLARELSASLPAHWLCSGVVRQQLLVHPDVPYTSHNSAACLILDGSGEMEARQIVDCAAEHIRRHFLAGSDPGLCVVSAGSGSIGSLLEFGLACTRQVTTRKQAFDAAGGDFLEGLGGTNDGVIGAAAAVGLTAGGWSGRYIEYGELRKLPGVVRVGELESEGIRVVSLDRDATLPASGDRLVTNHWVRPRLMGDRPVLLVVPDGKGGWVNIGKKRQKNGHRSAPRERLFN